MPEKKEKKEKKEEKRTEKKRKKKRERKEGKVTTNFKNKTKNKTFIAVFADTQTIACWRSSSARGGIRWYQRRACRNYCILCRSKNIKKEERRKER